MFKNSKYKYDLYFLFGCLVFGVFFRLFDLSLMEWKYDEIYMYFESQKSAASFSFPLLGMQSGAGILNPPISKWVFILLAMISKTPIQMVFWISFFNILAIFLFVYTFYKHFNFEKHRYLFYGLALFCVSTLPILFSRKIWAQCVLMFFLAPMFYAYFIRDKKVGALFWGLFGAILGQIHMAGFFMAFGLFAYTLYVDRKNNHPTKWGYWVLGSCLGSLPMLAWLWYMLTKSSEQASSIELKNILKLKFYVYWYLDAFGLHLKYKFRKLFNVFLAYPGNTYLVGALHAVAGIISLYTLKKVPSAFKASIQKGTSHKDSIENILIAMFLIFGVMINFTGVKFHAHYLITAYPFIHLSVAWILRDKLKVLQALIVVNMLITTLFFTYIINHNGIPRGEYGHTYKYIEENNLLEQYGHYKRYLRGGVVLGHEDILPAKHYPEK